MRMSKPLAAKGVGACLKHVFLAANIARSTPSDVGRAPNCMT